MKNSLASWTIAHFAVDMSCFYILYRGVEQLYAAMSWTHWQEMLAIAILLYNVLAFGLQIMFGTLTDRFPKLEKIIGIEGLDCMLVPLIIIWISQGPVASWTSMIIAAVLNAAFHVGGGVNVIRRSAGKMAPSGIFVSSGALGVITGTIYGASGHGALLPVFIVLIAIIMVFLTTDNWAQDLIMYYEREEKGDKLVAPVREYMRFNVLRAGSLAAVICLFFAVFIRSYAGFIWPLGFEKTGMLIILPAAASCLGKALGGIIADRLGAVETATVSLVLSMVLFLTGNGSWFMMGLAIMLFNMAMPITLCGLVAAVPENVGFAFGLSTLALLLGYILFTTGPADISDPAHLVVFLGIAAVALIAAALKRKYK
ncbi:MAG: MFS transporter [Clostridiales bacterium]|nr:MFS transporter [Clostridiales bacterium]